MKNEIRTKNAPAAVGAYSQGLNTMDASSHLGSFHLALMVT